MATLFISDVHVGPGNPLAGPLLIKLLDGTHGRIDALYILGDLFDAWVGDDDQRRLTATSVRHYVVSLKAAYQ